MIMYSIMSVLIFVRWNVSLVWKIVWMMFAHMNVISISVYVSTLAPVKETVRSVVKDVNLHFVSAEIQKIAPNISNARK